MVWHQSVPCLERGPLPSQNMTVFIAEFHLVDRSLWSGTAAVEEAVAEVGMYCVHTGTQALGIEKIGVVQGRTGLP